MSARAHPPRPQLDCEMLKFMVLGADRTPWHPGVPESKAEGCFDTVNNAPTSLPALPYRQPLLLRLLKVLVRGKFSVGDRI